MFTLPQRGFFLGVTQVIFSNFFWCGGEAGGGACYTILQFADLGLSSEPYQCFPLSPSVSLAVYMFCEMSVQGCKV